MNFKDPRPIRSCNDPRLSENRAVLQWFFDWSEMQKSETNSFITKECFDDLVSFLVGFEELVAKKISTCPLGYIKPSLINSDVVENVFCSQRGVCNGSTTNPTYLQYSKGINTIIIGQQVKSKKGNVSSSTSIHGALPYKMHTNKSFAKLHIWMETKSKWLFHRYDELHSIILPDQSIFYFVYAIQNVNILCSRSVNNIVFLRFKICWCTSEICVYQSWKVNNKNLNESNAMLLLNIHYM